MYQTAVFGLVGWRWSFFIFVRRIPGAYGYPAFADSASPAARPLQPVAPDRRAGLIGSGQVVQQPARAESAGSSHPPVRHSVTAAPRADDQKQLPMAAEHAAEVDGDGCRSHGDVAVCADGLPDSEDLASIRHRIARSYQRLTAKTGRQ